MKRGAPEEEVNDEPFLLLKVGEDEKGEAICAKVSVEDHAKLSSANWAVTPIGYGVGLIDKKVWRMHRYVKIVLQGEQNCQKVDHINSNRLDNRRSNLRFVTDSQNAANKSKKKGLSSEYHGVCWRKRNQKWYAFGTNEFGQRVELGSFDDEDEAAVVHDRYLIRFPDRGYKLNFPSLASEMEPFFRPFWLEGRLFRGVTYDQAKGEYVARVRVNKKVVHEFRHELRTLCALSYDWYVVENNTGHEVNFPGIHRNYRPNFAVKTAMEEVDETSVNLLLNDGYKVRVDKQDYYDTIQYCYCHVFPPTPSDGPRCKITPPRGSLIFLSRYLLGVKDPAIEVDHIDGDTLDHRRTKLRCTDHSGNCFNRKKLKDNDMPHGVFWCTTNKRFIAYIQLAEKQKKRHTKRFQDKEIAARYRDLYIRKHFPERVQSMNYDWSDPTEEEKWKKELGL